MIHFHKIELKKDISTVLYQPTKTDGAFTLALIRKNYVLLISTSKWSGQ